MKEELESGSKKPNKKKNKMMEETQKKETYAFSHVSYRQTPQSSFFHFSFYSLRSNFFLVVSLSCETL
jgi:hypothetical protein